MGLFDFFLGRRRHGSAQTTALSMSIENPSWILVEGGTPEAIRNAVVEYSGITKPVQASRHRITVLTVGAGQYGVTFDPPAPPYAFTNLIGWLDDPNMLQGARRAVGWLVSPESGIRYFLAPERANAGGDTLIGISSDGNPVAVFLPDCTLSPTQEQVVALPEPMLPSADAESVAFDVTLDGDTSFGNSQFVVE